MSPISIAIAGIGNVGQEVVAQLLKSKEYSKKFVIGPGSLGSTTHVLLLLSSIIM